MLISSLNSKKCLAVSLGLGLSLALCSANPVFAAKAPLTHSEILASLKQHLQTRRSTHFEPLLESWEKTYGTQAVDPLFTLARDTKLSDPDRYIALMGGAKLGGLPTSARLLPLLKDRSWMIRSGALRALLAVRAPQAGEAALQLLKDQALVVRLEAVGAVDRLQPPGSAPALLAALHDPANYHRGKAQWIPQRALAALVKMRTPDLTLKIKPLLARQGDPALHSAAIQSLEKLTGKTLKKGRPLAEQVKAWQSFLN